MFKRGDVIKPVEDWQFPQWAGATVISYDAESQTGTVKLKDGRVFEDFNLNPEIGVPFKCVSH